MSITTGTKTYDLTIGALLAEKVGSGVTFFLLEDFECYASYLHGVFYKAPWTLMSDEMFNDIEVLNPSDEFKKALFASIAIHVNDLIGNITGSDDADESIAHLSNISKLGTEIDLAYDKESRSGTLRFNLLDESTLKLHVSELDDDYLDALRDIGVEIWGDESE